MDPGFARDDRLKMTDTTLIHALHNIGAIQFGEFKLKSGQMSSVYLNLRKIISYPETLRAIAKAMWEKIANCKFDLICGVPYTALPIATCLSLTHDIPMIMRRKEKKDYGTKQMIEGVYQAGQSCLIMEDVITTGSSIFETADDLTAADLIVSDVVVFIDREQGGRNHLEKKFNVHTVFTITEILNTLLQSSLLNEKEHQHIEQFLQARMTA